MEHLRNLQVETLSLASLKPHTRNARTHSRKQVRQIAESIRKFGFVNPVLVDAAGGVIAGHGRIEASKLHGMDQVPAIRLADLTEAQKRAYIVADNKLAENAGWDKQLLALELNYVAQLDVEFDLTITGFESAEIDLVMSAKDVAGGVETADQLDDVDRAQPIVSRRGDLWLLDRHRLLCDDADREGSFDDLLDGHRAAMVFTDPRFEAASGRQFGGKQGAGRRRSVGSPGGMLEADRTAFFERIFGRLVEHSEDGSIHFICIDWPRCFELLSAGSRTYAELKALCVWNKDKAETGELYPSQRALVFVFRNGTASHTNNIARGRRRTDVWGYEVSRDAFGCGGVGAQASPAVIKPVDMIADAIVDCSKRNALVLDCFGGNGNTIIAALKTGRLAAVMESNPACVDAAVRRFEKTSGEQAVHAITGKTFADLTLERTRANHAIDNNGGDAGGDADVDQG